jgi:putative NADH-flavin reductase
MKIAVIGASGSAGSRIVNEALLRKHQVIAIARHPDKISERDGVTRVAGDISQPEALAKALSEADVVVSAVRFVGFDIVDLLSALGMAGRPRLLMVGGAGSLLTTSGALLSDTPTFPEAAKAEAKAGGEKLNALQVQNEIDWTFVSPSALFMPGERTGNFRVGKDQLLIGEDGKSRISQEDYAIAFLDELESATHLRQRITVGY